MKPYEVELCVAEVGDAAENDQLYRLTFDGSIVDEPDFVVMGGQAEAIYRPLREHFSTGMDLSDGVRALGRQPGRRRPGRRPGRRSTAAQLEVAVLDRRRPRAFRRVTGSACARLLGDEATPDATADAPAAHHPAERPRPTARRAIATTHTADPAPRRRTSASGKHAWTDGSSASRPSTASRALQGPAPALPGRGGPLPVPPGGFLGPLAKRLPGATAPGSTSTSAATPSTPPPSATTFAELVAHDKAGERILEGLLVDAEQRLPEEGIAGDIYLFKNNTDSAGNSYGCHENYLVGRARRVRPARRRADPVPRQPADRAAPARSLQTPAARSTDVSQRAEHIWEGVSSATTRSRPIINTRDEPHADAERYRRLHVIVGDSNMSETTTLLKVGIGDLVLRMIEAGVPMRDMTLENPIRAIREISHDMSGRRKVRLANGRECRALEIQSEYHAPGRRVHRPGGLPPRAQADARPVGPQLKAVDTGDLSLVDARSTG